MLVKCHLKYTRTAIAHNIGLFVFNTDVTVWKPKIKS